ncbi:MAG: hypothetical protein K2X81_17615, partial [Candidatus Obscuribacterales bacterium]|nr:hypothetical protein [Candidatus Obscuribacterales bacterium]
QDELLQLVECYKRTDDYDAAESVIKECLKNDGDVIDLRTLLHNVILGEILILKGKESEGERLISKCLTESKELRLGVTPDYVSFRTRAFVSLAQLALSRGEWEKAEGYYEEEESDHNPGSLGKVEIQSIRSDLYAKNGKIDKAIAIRKEIIQHLPENLRFEQFVGLRVPLATLYLEKGRIDLGLSEYVDIVQKSELQKLSGIETAVASQFMCTNLIAPLHELYLRKDEMDEFKKLCKDMIAKTPPHSFRRTVWMAAYAKSQSACGDYASALSSYNDAVAELPGSREQDDKIRIPIEIAMSEVYLHLNKIAEAKGQIQKVLSLLSKYPSWHLLYADAKFAEFTNARVEGQESVALSALAASENAWFEQNPEGDYQRAYYDYERGILFTRLKKHAEAAKYFQAAAKRADKVKTDCGSVILQYACLAGENFLFDNKYKDARVCLTFVSTRIDKAIRSPIIALCGFSNLEKTAFHEFLELFAKTAQNENDQPALIECRSLIKKIDEHSDAFRKK